ncbi:MULTISPECIES: hypothetical protein [Aurantimonadaceae]|uniref:Uncharacterized protein n=1 Tax=Jiella pacifica TaxID=2696469 RepID=A0A6N9TG56_9HYPH|nr:MULTISPECIES: hypothetical protein [Aurantimonadaceae]MCK5932190.1 hypothetical protein [Fulvimarina manganoxydans]NDW07848.1 hypothetical protein [Jiella pacifica]
MTRVLHNLAIGICAVVYALVGLTFGVTTGFIVLKLVELIFGFVIVSPAVQWVVAGWAIFVAVLAVVAYLRSPSGDRVARE